MVGCAYELMGCGTAYYILPADMEALALLAGPQAIVKAYREFSSVIIYQRHRPFLSDPYPDRQFFQDALAAVWLQRSFVEEDASPIVILDEVLGERDECSYQQIPITMLRLTKF